MLALFRRFFRWLKPDGVRAPEWPESAEMFAAEHKGKPYELRDGWLMIRLPVPPEERLLEMLYNGRERDRPLGMMIEFHFDPEFVEEMLEHRKSVQRAGTPGQRKSETSQD